jgi:hypothetical protein
MLGGHRTAIGELVWIVVFVGTWLAGGVGALSLPGKAAQSYALVILHAAIINAAMIVQAQTSRR